jgi:uncharacterized protein (TIGR02996 family)
MNVEHALIQEIAAHPDDDLPRLALADWLEEHGRQERAELVRVQVALARLAEDDERRPRLLARQTWLLQRHSLEWGKPLRGLARRWEFRRGCVEGVTLPARRFPARAAKLFERAPLRHLHLAAPEDHQALAACPELARISELTLTAPHGYPSYTRFHPLLRSPHLQGLRSLRLCGGQWQREELLAIAALSELEVLELRSCSHFGRQIPLVAAGKLPRLRWLSLTGWPGPVEWRSVVGRLEVLEWHSADIRDVLRQLTDTPRTTPLRGLRLRTDLSAWVGGTAGEQLDHRRLLASGVLANLDTLELRGCALDHAKVARLFSKEGPARLVHLDLGFNPLGLPGVEALLPSPHLGYLTHLGLARIARPTDTANLVRPLCNAPPPRLAALDLSGDQVTDDEALELAASPLADQLYRLDLRRNGLGDRGVEALLAADWPRLVWLDVSDNNLSPTARAALRQRFGYSVRY